MEKISWNERAGERPRVWVRDVITSGLFSVVELSVKASNVAPESSNLEERSACSHNGVLIQLPWCMSFLCGRKSREPRSGDFKLVKLVLKVEKWSSKANNF